MITVLWREGTVAIRKRVRRLMRELRIRSVIRKKRSFTDGRHLSFFRTGWIESLPPRLRCFVSWRILPTFESGTTLLIYRWCRICTTIRKDFFRSMLTLAGPLRMWQMQSVPIRAFVRILRFLFPNQPFDTLNHPIQKIIDFVHIIAPEHSLELLVVDVEGVSNRLPPPGVTGTPCSNVHFSFRTKIS